ncbi:unnamed protein product, partial [Didymodactylos carnosus]
MCIRQASTNRKGLDAHVDTHNYARSLLDNKTDDYWKDLARRQLDLTQVRLVFRPLYYPDVQPPTFRGTLSLPLRDQLEIRLKGRP